MKNVTNNNTRKLLIKTIANKYNNFRALEFIVSVDNKEYEKNSLTYQYMKQVKVNTIFNEKLRDAQDIFSTLKPENIKNVLLKQGDTKYVDAFNKNFNSKEYIKNTEIDPKKIVDSFDNIKKECSNNSFNGKEKDIEKAVKLASYEIVTNKNLLNSKEFSKLCNLGGIESYKAIRAVSGTRDIAKFLKSNVDESTKDGINKDNIDLSANTLKVLNDQYSKRGFFGRFFRKEARDENKLINTLKDNFKKAGINENEINSFLKGETEISSLGGNIKEDKKVLLDIKSLDEDFTLSKEELDNSKTLSKNLEQDLSDELEV